MVACVRQHLPVNRQPMPQVIGFPRGTPVACGRAMRSELDLLTDLVGRRAAIDLLRRFGSIGEIRRATQLGLQTFATRRVRAAFAIADLLVHAGEKPAVVSSPEDAFALLAGDLLGAESEELWGLYLDVRHRPIAKLALTRGTRTQTIVDPAAVFRKALQVGAHAVIVAHNHPSGDATPSLEDFTATTRLVELGQLLGIAVLDHLVIAGATFTSLRTHGGVPSYGSP
jgi:DNA repair protein RadC